MTRLRTAPGPTGSSLLVAQRPLAAAQWAAILGSIAVLVWSIPGIIVNPDFSTGDAATSEVVLGVDMNGWHALSGFLVAIPGFFAALRPSWAAAFDLAAAGSLIATGVWALMDTQVAGGLFYFPNGTPDALLHFGTSTIFLAGGAHHFLTRDG
ncbi:MAG: hypothetical protein K0S15_1130 [Solirubrobacterales bacterium]|jgi:hypothetical protein|nr:hypothetical protein [Solirubrobacterales bacterium]